MNNPQFRGNVTWLQITPKSRSAIEEYAAMEREIEAAAGRINGTFGDVSWTPVRYTNRAYSRTVLSGLYRSAKVGLVTPLRDGMNLVCKEYVAAQDPEDPGVLILSRFAGAAAEFGAALLFVNPVRPRNRWGCHRPSALVMPRDERVSRHKALVEALLRNDIATWGERFLAALNESGEAMGARDRDTPAAHAHSGAARKA